MEEFIYLNELYDYYKELLTKKQQDYFEEYYFNNFSLTEIAENYEVSRNAVSKQLQIVVEYLKNFEKKLQLVEKRKKIIELKEKYKDNNVLDEILEII